MTGLLNPLDLLNALDAADVEKQKPLRSEPPDADVYLWIGTDHKVPSNTPNRAGEVLVERGDRVDREDVAMLWDAFGDLVVCVDGEGNPLDAGALRRHPDFAREVLRSALDVDDATSGRRKDR